MAHEVEYVYGSACGAIRMPGGTGLSVNIQTIEALTGIAVQLLDIVNMQAAVIEQHGIQIESEDIAGKINEINDRLEKLTRGG